MEALFSIEHHSGILPLREGEQIRTHEITGNIIKIFYRGPNKDYNLCSLCCGKDQKHE